MKLHEGDWKRLIAVTLLSSTAIAYMTFNFMFPNVAVPPMGKSLLWIFLISVLIAMPAGYFMKRTDLALSAVILFSVLGYVVALVLYSAPYLFYDLEMLLPDFYYGMFFRVTIVLIFIYILGGFIGAVAGQMIGDSISKDQTRLTFQKEQ